MWKSLLWYSVCVMLVVKLSLVICLCLILGFMLMSFGCLSELMKVIVWLRVGSRMLLWGLFGFGLIVNWML